MVVTTQVLLSSVPQGQGPPLVMQFEDVEVGAANESEDDNGAEVMSIDDTVEVSASLVDGEAEEDNSILLSVITLVEATTTTMTSLPLVVVKVEKDVDIDGLLVDVSGDNDEDVIVLGVSDVLE